MNPLDHMVVVLYQPQDVVNVAAVVRVMANFGLSRLRLVAPAAFDAYRIEGIAHRTGAIVAGTRCFPDLATALADCGLVVGTTGRCRAVGDPAISPRAAVPRLVAAADPRRPAALLFGREDDGLPNAALLRCHLTVTIPTDPVHPSLNLAQAVLVLAYELRQSASALPPPPARLTASGAQRQALLGALAEALPCLYPRTSPGRLHQSLARLSALLLRAEPAAVEAQALTNLFRHIAHRLGSK